MQQVLRPSFDLQTMLSAASATPEAYSMTASHPHHPITCPSTLAYHEDGSFSCEHATVPPHDLRTKLCLDHSTAVLLVELAQAL